MTSSIRIKTVVRRTFAAYAAQARVLLPAAAVSFVILAGLNARPAKSSTVLVIGAFILSILVFALFTGMVVTLAANAWEDKPDLTATSLVLAAKPVLGELILVGFVTLIAITFFYSLASLLLIAVAIGAVVGVGANAAGIGVIAVLGFVLLLAPGTYLLTVWAVAIPVVVLERPGGLGALTRSSDLVRGHRWRVLVLAVLFWLTAGVGARALGLAGHTGLGVVIQLIAATLIAPIPLLGATALYFELRQSAATDMPKTDTSPHAPLGNTTPPSTVWPRVSDR